MGLNLKGRGTGMRMEKNLQELAAMANGWREGAEIIWKVMKEELEF